MSGHFFCLLYVLFIFFNIDLYEVRLRVLGCADKHMMTSYFLIGFWLDFCFGHYS